MKGLFEILAWFSLGRIADLAFDLAKGYFVRLYAGATEFLRNIYVLTLLGFGCLLLISTGFLLLHAALFLYLSWPIADKILLFAGLGLSYMFFPILIVARLQSRHHWLKRTGLKNILQEMNEKKS